MENKELKNVELDVTETEIETKEIEAEENNKRFTTGDAAAIAVGSASIGAAVVILMQKIICKIKEKKARKTTKETSDNAVEEKTEEQIES